jgi:hypothetical protein
MSRAVIDQPGVRVVGFGLILALILGFILRSQISSQHVEKSLQRSVQILEKDFLVDFDMAEVRLSKWGWPLPHLIIAKLRISPKEKKCHNSQIYIDELEVPLSLKNLFSTEKTVDLVRAKNVEVRLAEVDSCLSHKSDASDRSAASTKESAAETSEDRQTAGNQLIAQSGLFAQKTGTKLKEIAIDELKIMTSKAFDQPLVFKQFKIFLDYENSRLAQIDLKSRFYYIKDSRSDIYFLISDINARIRPETENHIGATIQLKGRLLDGDIQAFVQASTQNKKATYEVTTKNVSLKAYAPLFNRNSKSTPLDKWPLSTSFYMVGEAQQAQDLKAIFKFKNFDATGENMKIEFPEINLEVASGQAVLRPFQVSLNQIPLTPLKQALADQYDFQSVENLGVINGLFKYEDRQHWNFDGDIQKMQLIFSNRGSREIEVIDSVGVSLDYKGKRLQFGLDDIVIQQNPVTGGLEGEYSKDPQSMQLKLELEGKVLNEKIWKQLTQVSQSPSIKLNWVYKKSNEERHQIKINSSELEFPGFKLADVQIDFLQLMSGEVKSLALSLKTARAEIKVPSLKPNISKAFFNEETELNGSEVYTAMKTQVGLQGADWKNMNFDVDANLFDADGVKSLEHIKAKGEWKSDSSLSGFASLQNPRRTLKYNLVKKNKDEIEFIPEKKVE